MARRVTQPVDAGACGRAQAPGPHESQPELTSLRRFREQGRKKSAAQVALAAGRCCSKACPPRGLLHRQRARVLRATGHTRTEWALGSSDNRRQNNSIALALLKFQTN